MKLGQFQARANEWRAAIAAMAAHGDGEQVLQVFERAITAFAGMVEHGLRRADAAEVLTDLAQAYGVELEPDEIEQHIAEAFSKVKVNGKTQAKSNGPDPDEWDAGDEPGAIPPRQWLLGNHFCRGFVSSIVAAGGGGKTSLRILQFISMALGRSLCGQHVFRQSRVLLVSLEDDRDEIQRRISAALKHFNIDRTELKGWLFCATPRH